MPDYKAKNMGAPIGVLTLTANYPAVNYDELIGPNVQSAATIQAIYLPEARRVYIPGITSSHESFGPGRVLLTDLGVAPGADFVIDTFAVPRIPTGRNQA